jgi:DNA mismatch repair protein MutS2
VDAKALHLLDFDKIRRQLAEHAAFGGGRQLALALEPAADTQEVRARLARTRQARDYQDRRGGPELGGAHDVRSEVEAAGRDRTLLPQELLDIRDTIAAARRFRRAIDREAARWPELAGLAERLEPCPALFDAIGQALDDSGAVLDSASPALKRIRRELRVAHDRIMRQLQAIVGRVEGREFLQEALITQRSGRYVIPVKSEFRGRLPGVVHDTSDSGATVFVEPLAVVDAGNRYRELEVEEQKEVERVLRELTSDVAAEADALHETLAALAELDLAFACASYAYALRAVEPKIVTAPRPLLEFPRARHPLLDPETVVPINVRAGEDFRLLVITGPNTGGKTVTLKTVGLLVLMAQAGLQLPVADGARMTVFDGVFADIGDEQSIEQSLSTFSGHLTNIIAILTSAGPQSLVLLDELGAGTDPVEGAALAGALLEHLRRRGITTLASTHTSELKVYAHATPDVANASVEFDLETLRPTFELTIGLPGRSNALAIAERLGLPAEIVAEARSGLAITDVAMEDLLAEIRDARQAAVADRAAAADARRQADAWAARLEEALHALEVERAEILNAARRDATAELAGAREAIAALLRQAEATAADAGAAAQIRQDLAALEAILAEEPEPRAAVTFDRSELHPGSSVHVRRFNGRGEVVRLLDGEVEVQLGRLRLTVPWSEVEPAGGPEEVAPASTAPRLTQSAAAAHVGIELDLRGARVEEALEQLDGYLDDAFLAGLPWVRIIHGHGTGALRTAVREMLRQHPQVARSRSGEQGEGGNGVTIAYLTHD